MTNEIIFSVSEFIEYINLAVGRRVVVEGEISSYSVNNGKWIFFDLKDENSKINCFAPAWNVHAALEDGMQVHITGAPRIYGKSGKFSLTVESVELKGAGSLKRAFELTKAKLEKEGLFDTARKRPLPEFLTRVALVCSRESAAYSDFMRILNNRWGGVSIFLLHVQVQGDIAVDEIECVFSLLNAESERLGIEAAVLIRGGGSMEDLQAFNTERVARAVFGSTIPVLCGVGHERDETLADYAADVRAATPTHAATLLVPDREELVGRIEYWKGSLTRGVESHLQTYRQTVGRHELILFHGIETFSRRFSFLFEKLKFAHERLVSSLQKKREACVALKRTLANMSPLTVLARGYSIVRKEGRVVSSVRETRTGDVMNITLSDGNIDARIV